jgi:YesN/AraC family two-component response regulator
MKQNFVLFVDDELNILSAIRRAVMDEDFMALFASGGEEALKIMEEKEIAVLVTDMRMPGMDGLSLLKMIKARYPDTIKIVLSGYTHIGQILATINQGDIFRFITKPWDMEADLLNSVKQGLEYYNLKKERVEFKELLEKKNKAYQQELKSLDGRISLFKQDLKSIKNFNDLSFQYVLSHTEEREKIAYMGKVHHSFLGILPTGYSVVTLESAINEVKEFADQIKADKLLFQCAPGNSEWYGNRKLMIWVMCLLVAQILSLQVEVSGQCVLGVIEKDSQKKCLMRIVIQMKKEEDKTVLLQDKAFDRLRFLVEILNKVIVDGFIAAWTEERTKGEYAINGEFA